MNFRHITPLDFPELKPFFKRQKYRLCYYSLPSILTWSNQLYQPHGIIDGDTLIIGIEYATRIEDRHLMLPISPAREYDPEELRNLALKLGFDKYRYVSGEYMTKYGENRVKPFFHIKEQKKYEDYIYLAEDMATLKGRKYSKKRNLINQFKRDYINNGRVEVETITPSSTSDCIDFIEKWCIEHNMDMDEDEDLAFEKEAIICNIENIEILETPGIFLRIDGEIRAFGLGAHLTDNTGVLHYEKAYSRIKGLYQYFDSLCSELFFEGYEYINKESDMNQPGIAKAKKSYYPVMMVKSYELIVRE
jgi:hypothetical protein